MTRALRLMPFPTGPEQVEAYLDMACEGPIAVEIDGTSGVVITTTEDYDRLLQLDQAVEIDGPLRPG